MKPICHIFLSKLVIDTDTKNTYYEIVYNKDLELSIMSRLVSPADLAATRAIAEDDNYIYNYDFSIENNILRGNKLPSVSLPTSIIEKMLMVPNLYFDDLSYSVYGLFSDLVSTSAKFIDIDYDIDNISYSNFIPNYAKTTMNVFVRVLTDDGWRSRRLIRLDLDGDDLETGDLMFSLSHFNVGLTDDNKFIADKYNLELIETLDSNDYPFKYIYKCSDKCRAGLFTTTKYNSSLISPLVNMYNYKTKLLDKYSLVCKEFINMLLDTTEESPVKKDSKPSKPTVKYNIAFQLKSPFGDLTVTEISDVVLQLVYKDLVGKEITDEVLDSAIKVYTGDAIDLIIIKYLVQILSSIDQADLFNYFVELEADCRKRKFYCDTILYLIRSLLFNQAFFEKSSWMKLPTTDLAVSTGANLPYYTVIRKINKRGF